MFTIPAVLSIGLDASVVILYLRNSALFDAEWKRPTQELFDLSLCSFDVALLAALRILFLFPYIWSCLRRLRVVYSFIPWTWLAFNMGMCAARLVFLLTSLDGGHDDWEAQYVVLALSALSVVLQTSCFEHLRSSAPREKRIFLASAVNRADVSARLLDPTTRGSGSAGASSTELYDGHQEDVDFIEFITSKMKAARMYWTDKTEALRDYLTDLSQGRDQHSSPFNLLLRLFKYDDVLGELDEVFAQCPAAIEFYIPQLVTFLLYGAFWSSASLQAFLLDKSARSVQFAHRLYWFLNASCLSGSGINPEGVDQVRGLIAEVVAKGQIAALLLDQGKTPQEESALSNISGPTQSSSLGPSGQGAVAGGGAHVCVDVHGRDSGDTSRLSSSHPSTLSSFTSSSSLPPPSFPLDKGHYRGDGTPFEHFHMLPRFTDSLVHISQSLLAVPRDQRNPILRARLQELSDATLPCNVIYLPVGNACHRVWKIHVNESSAFSTKERVPCLVCFEVVDYYVPKAPGSTKHGSGSKKWWSSMVGDNMPHISHTFRLGNKEWTFKLGDPSATRTPSTGGAGASGGPPSLHHAPSSSLDTSDPTGGHGSASTSASTSTATPTTSTATPLVAVVGAGPSSPPPPPAHPSSPSSTATATPALNRQRSGSLDASMGQWASKASSLSSPLPPHHARGHSDQGPQSLPPPPSPMSASASPSLFSSADAPLRTPLLEHNTSSSRRRTPSPPLPSPAPYSLPAPPTPSPLPPPILMTNLPPSDDYGTFSPHDPSPSGGFYPEPHPTSSSSTPTAPGSSHATSFSSTSAPPPSLATHHHPSPPVIFKEKWRQKEARIRQSSEIGHLPGWRLLPVIIKSNDDLRQEQFASQVLRQIANIVREAHLPVWLRPYDIVATSLDGGLLEAIPDTVSLDALRRNDPRYTTLLDFFQRLFGPKGSRRLNKARQCFVESMAAYSIVCYLLQIKDRHNGNILLDAHGHIIHIDFGFLLAKSPGNVNFERAPFKLTNEFVELMDGPRSPLFKRFRELCVKTYMELRRQRHKVILLVEMVANGNEHLPCFGGKPQAAVEALRQRFQPESNDRACIEFVHSLIDQSLDNWSTRWYDRYQSCFVGIA